MKFKISKKKMFILLIFIIILIYLNYPSRVNLDVDTIESITVNLSENNSVKNINYFTKITDYDTMLQVSEILNKISYKKISYLFDISALGNTGYNVEIKDKNGTIDIINVYFDDTARIQSNGRYKLPKGVALQIYDELLAILKAK